MSDPEIAVITHVKQFVVIFQHNSFALIANLNLDIVKVTRDIKSSGHIRALAVFIVQNIKACESH